MSEHVQPLPPSAGVSTRQLYNLDAEGAVLSTMLLDSGRYGEVAQLLPEEAFWSEANKWVYRGVAELTNAGERVDIVTVAQWLHGHGKLVVAGGTPYLNQLTDATPAVANVLTHARIVHDLWRLRLARARARELLAEIDTGEAFRSADDTQALLERAEVSFGRITHQSATSPVVLLREHMLDANQQMQEAVARGSAVRGATTGYPALDAKLSGLQETNLYIVAGRPSMGKTALVLNMLARTAAAGEGAALFSAEMPGDQLALRMIASEARIDFSLLLNPIRLQASDWNGVAAAIAALEHIPLWIDETAVITVPQIRARVRRLKAEIAAGKHPVKCGHLRVVAVDYLQLLASASEKKGQTREQDIADISRGLKSLAKEEDVAVIALSQLNRKVEERPDKRPQLADLRESGAIEQDADVVMFLFRPEYYLKQPDPALEGFVEVGIAKQRNGALGTVKLAFQKKTMRFDTLADEGYDEYSDWQDT